jgi:16S rRNA (cytosine967-C5)-methyltransferase
VTGVERDTQGRSGHGPARAGRGRPAPDPARRAAYDLLRAVDERGAYANLALPALLRERRLSGRDAAFTTELAYGTLRGRGSYDPVIAACVDRPLERVDPQVLDLLRLGAHQLLAMRVPAHAAVSATVELARQATGGGRAAFVNAVLRKVAADGLDGWMDVVAPAGGDPVGSLAVRLSHPRWIVEAFRDSAGGSLARTAAILAADNVPAAVTLAARPGRCELAELEALGARAGRWSPFAAVLSGGDPGALPAVREGRAGVQDEGSQLCALALAAAPLHGADRRWLDLCAGPGGKAALLDGLVAGRGGRLLSAERRQHRAGLVARSVAPTRRSVVVADATSPPWRDGSFDRVLADVPCSGLGALRRRPEARWRRTPGDLAALAPLQRALLSAGADALRPGGLVAYVTCSPHLAETVVVVGDVLAARDDLEPVDARGLLPGVPSLGEGPFVQLWPDLHGTDAMFLALLRRTSQARR